MRYDEGTPAATASEQVTDGLTAEGPPAAPYGALCRGLTADDAPHAATATAATGTPSKASAPSRRGLPWRRPGAGRRGAHHHRDEQHPGRHDGKQPDHHHDDQHHDRYGDKHHDDHHHDDHHHAISVTADRRYLAGAMGLLLAFMVAELLVAAVTGSLALLSDAGHMLSDVGAIVGSLWAIHLAQRPPEGRMTFGWKRAEILAAGANGTTLVVLGLVLGFESIRRLLEPPDVDAGPVLAVALAGVVVNVLATVLIARADRTSLNIEGAYQHIVTDLYGFLGTALAAVVILLTGWVRADAVASLVVVVIMLRAGWSLVREAGRVLLEAAPGHLDLDDVRTHLLAVDHVREVHDLHAWTVTSSMPALSAHVVLDDSCFHDGHAPQILDRLQRCLGRHFAIVHTTFQVEPYSHGEHETGCRTP